MKWYEDIKKGDFVVNISSDYNDTQIGFIYEVDYCQVEKAHWWYIKTGLGRQCAPPMNYGWRPATQQEKELYLLFGKPVHINTPLPKDNGSTALKTHSNELLEEAKRKYTKGTKVVCLEDGVGYIIDGFNEVIGDMIWFKSPNREDVLVFSDGVWAEIISEPKQSNRCVHVTTKQQWDFVSGKLKYSCKGKFQQWFEDGDGDSINLMYEGWNALRYYQKQNYQILSFWDWLGESGNHREWNSQGSKSIHHIDRDRTNNKKENLVWCEPRTNSLQTTKNNIVLLGEFEPIVVNEYKETKINF
jgi:hypothetical protein